MISQRAQLEDYFRSLSSDALREFRTDYLHLSQERMAHKLGISAKTQNRWEQTDPKRHSQPSPLAAYFAVEKFSEQLERYYKDRQNS